MKIDFRSDCPISSALDILGDKWTLIILRDMLFFHKKTFKDFASSKERIASNILSSRLKLLEKVGIIKKNMKEENLKSYIYTLTDKGLDLLPVILEITLWSNENISYLNPKLLKKDYNNVRTNKQKYLEELKVAYLRSIDFQNTNTK